MNKKLRFSWGHIIALVAMIFIGYVVFMGGVYAGMPFIVSGIVALVIDIVLFIFTIVPQFLKGTAQHFSARILWERILLFSSPVVFILLLLLPFSPFAHFWSVYSEKDEIIGLFTKSVSDADTMFVQYEDYSKGRLRNYDKTLTRLASLSQGDAASDSLSAAEAEAIKKFNLSAIQINIRKEALYTLLMPQNYKELKESSEKWMAGAANVSIWNVFLLGNVSTISDAFKGWHQHLVEQSTRKMPFEEGVAPFDADGKSIAAATSGLDGISKYYNENGFSLLTYVLGIVCYLMLIFPWTIQKRDSRAKAAGYTIFTNDKFAKKNDNNNQGDGFMMTSLD